ncbi:glycosyl transferase [Spirochaetia bacterium]|nr:glycosyl transferase [Spirochaetia bacterium]
MGLKVSIITPTKNDADQLEQIIAGVAKQDYDNIEYIIVDGASTDRTGEVLEKAKARFKNRLTVISEPDHGIFEASNKGLAHATGEIIGFCTDLLLKDDIIGRMMAIIEREQTDGVHADLNYVAADGKIVRKWRQGQGNIRFGWMPATPTLYIKREIYEKYGLPKENYKMAGDYEFAVRILKDKQVRLSYIPEVVVNMLHGGTTTNGLKAYLISLKEGHRALKENGIRFAFFTDFCRICRILFQFF